jgi:hypothetical protein
MALRDFKRGILYKITLTDMSLCFISSTELMNQTSCMRAHKDSNIVASTMGS